MKLTVVTHTCPAWGRDISRCVNSVKAALPPNATHEIIEMNDSTKFQQLRYDATKLGDVIVFVDDDDYISPDSLSMCMDALSESNAGIAFTNEVLAQPDGVLRYNNRQVNYNMICIHPQIIHHMSAIRTKYVSIRSLDLALTHNCGVEWIMKAEVAFTGGAIHVPIDAYYWVQHAKQYHREKEWQSAFIDKTQVISNELRLWNSRTGDIPQYKVPTL